MGVGAGNGGAGGKGASGVGGSKVLREGPGPGRIINYRTDPFTDPFIYVGQKRWSGSKNTT